MIWRRCATVIAAYRDRYGITTASALGAAESTRQKIDEARAQAVLTQAQRIMNPTQNADPRRTGRESAGHAL